MLITSGCGISQISWNRWPTWPKYCSMAVDHINLGAPAAGNYYIAMSLLRQLEKSKPDCVIVTWTSYEKLDVLVDSKEFADEIRNYPSRNFLVGWDGLVTDGNTGWWPSSVSNDNPYKREYNKRYNETDHALTTLNSVYVVQEYCRKNSIPLYQWMSYSWPLEEWASRADTRWLHGMIDWTSINPKILADDYFNGPWRKYQTGSEYGLIPVAGWHAEFFRDDIWPILNKHLTPRDIQLDKLVAAAAQLTERIHDEDRNIP